MHKLPAWLRLMRPNQWAKNLFVFGPALFGTRASDPTGWLESFIAFATFCLAASLVYVVNDYLDVEEDRQHPTKRFKRPIASGEVSQVQARWLALILAVLVGIALFRMHALLLPLGAYLLVNIAYSTVLRGIPVVDLVIISFAFVARVWAGAAAIEVPLTPWILIDTFFLALYLASMKRRHEFLQNLGSARKSLKSYSLGLINTIVAIAAFGAIVGYAIFAFGIRPELSLTVIFVVLGIWRFWRLASANTSADSPTDMIVRDWWLITISAAWVIACAVILVLG